MWNWLLVILVAIITVLQKTYNSGACRTCYMLVPHTLLPVNPLRTKTIIFKNLCFIKGSLNLSIIKINIYFVDFLCNNLRFILFMYNNNMYYFTQRIFCFINACLQYLYHIRFIAFDKFLIDIFRKKICTVISYVHY